MLSEIIGQPVGLVRIQKITKEFDSLYDIQQLYVLKLLEKGDAQDTSMMSSGGTMFHQQSQMMLSGSTGEMSAQEKVTEEEELPDDDGDLLVNGFKR